MIDLFLLLVAIGATTKRVNAGNTVGRVASVRSQLYLNGCDACVADCIANCIRLAVPQPTKWQRIGD
jgi:Na+-translocating ferredoxin:NAD+ oxidoreductase RNF subunit RnfB